MKFRRGGDVEHQLDLMLNNGLTFVDNVDGGMFEITTTGDVQELTHNLGYVPSGFIVLFISGEAMVWGENLESWTTSRLFLNANAANLRVRLFVV